MHGINERELVKPTIQDQNLPGSFILIGNMAKGTPFGYANKMGGGCGMFTVFPHSEWPKDPPHRMR